MKNQPLKRNKATDKLVVISGSKAGHKSASGVQVVVTDSGNIDQKSSGSGSQDQVTRLVAKKRFHSESMTHQPHVKELLEAQDIELDVEDVWGSEGENGAATLQHWRWGGGILIIAIVVAVGFVAASFRLLDSSSAGGISAIEDFTRVDELSRVVNTREDLMSDLESVKRCLDGYFGADTIAEKLKYVRDAEVVEPKMIDHYSRFELKPLTGYTLRNQTGSMFSSKALTRVKLKLAGGGFRSLILEQLVDGSYRVDWESDGCYLPVDWNVFRGQQNTDTDSQEDQLFTEPLVMRVYVEEITAYSYEYSDDEQYSSYRLSTRDQLGAMDAYVEKNSDAGVVLARAMEKTVSVGWSKLRPLTLALRTVKRGGGKTVAIIDGVLSSNWVYVNDDE